MSRKDFFKYIGAKVVQKINCLREFGNGFHQLATRLKGKETLKRIYELFPVLEERKHQKAGTLSGGEQQTLSIGRGLIVLPRVLMLDGPSLRLALLLVKEIFDTIIELNKKEHLTIFLVEQS